MDGGRSGSFEGGMQIKAGWFSVSVNVTIFDLGSQNENPLFRQRVFYFMEWKEVSSLPSTTPALIRSWGAWQIAATGFPVQRSSG